VNGLFSPRFMALITQLVADSPAHTHTPPGVELDLPEDGGTKILSKKEKEKLKKDREKVCITIRIETILP
jgi:hypothetical protein